MTIPRVFTGYYRDQEIVERGTAKARYFQKANGEWAYFPRRFIEFEPTIFGDEVTIPQWLARHRERPLNQAEYIKRKRRNGI